MSHGTVSSELCSLVGVMWAHFLLRTGRVKPARLLTRRNLEVSERNGWNENRGRCQAVLARIDLQQRFTVAAGQTGDLDSSDAYLSEALDIAAPRAHARLDVREQRDLGWAERVQALETVLVPPDLRPDPVADLGLHVDRLDKPRTRNRS